MKLKIRIKPVYGRITAYSLIPLILVILGTYAGIYFLSGNSLFVELSNEYQEDELEHHLLVTDQQASNLEQTFVNLERSVILLKGQIDDTLSQTGTRASYFHDVTEDRQTPRPEFSQKYNKTVDFSVSSYFIYPANTFGNYSSSLNNTIQQTSLLDIGFLSIYQTNEDILWMQVFFNESGIERTYPFNGPINNNHNPRNTTAYNLTSAIISSDFYHSEPYIDEYTNRTVLSVVTGLYDDTDYLGYIQFKILMTEIVHDLEIISKFQDRAFLVNEEFQTVYHSDMENINSILNDTGQLQSIGIFESNLTNFFNLITSAQENEVTYIVMEYEDQGLEQLVAVRKIKGFIFGLVEVLIPTEVIGTFNLIEFLIVPLSAIAFIGLIMILLFRRYGFLRNIGLDTLIELEKSVTSKVNAIASFEVDDIGEYAADKIKEKGEKIVEDIEALDKKAQMVAQNIKNVDKFTAAKLNEQLLSFENKLFVAIDHKFENVEQLIQNAKGVISISSDQLRSLINDPEAYIARQMNVFGVQSADSPEKIAELPNEMNRLVAILTNLDEIELQKMAELTKKNPENLGVIIGALPEDFGLTLAGSIVNIDKSVIMKNLPHLIQIYYQINAPETLSVRQNLSTLPNENPAEVVDSLISEHEGSDKKSD